MSSRVLIASLLRNCRPNALKQVARPSAWNTRQFSVSARVLATPPPFTTNSSVPLKRYHELSDATMDALVDSLESLLDTMNNPKYEVEYSSGVLTLNLADNGIYVINKQPPNKQIWLSSPISGPKRYDYDEKQDGWYYSRDQRSIGNLLEEELSQAFGQKVSLHVDEVSKLVE